MGKPSEVNLHKSFWKEVMWVPCHHGLACHHVLDGGDDLHRLGCNCKYI